MAEESPIYRHFTLQKFGKRIDKQTHSPKTIFSIWLIIRVLYGLIGRLFFNPNFKIPCIIISRVNYPKALFFVRTRSPEHFLFGIIPMHALVNF